MIIFWFNLKNPARIPIPFHVRRFPEVAMERTARSTRSLNWSLDESNYLSGEEILALRAALAIPAGGPLPGGARAERTRSWFLLELGLQAGLRVMEMAGLRVGDLDLYPAKPVLRVLHGKGDRDRDVLVGSRFARNARRYLDWKRAVREPTGPDDYLIPSPRTGGRITTRALQYRFGRLLGAAGLAGRYSIHGLRHTYAVFLYKASNHNLRFVQKQLGHASIGTTQVYLEALLTDSREALERLYA